MLKKGQLSLSDAPQVVLLVGLVFLFMATIALISQSFGDSLPDDSYTVLNESGGFINATGYELNDASVRGFNSPSITEARNATDNTVIGAGNYTVSSDGVVTNATATTFSDVNFDYTYNANSAAENVTGDLNTEIDNNTSIAGIVLTISLVGIVLTVLIGIFVGFRRRNI